MNAGLPSILSEFDTPDQEASYTAWLRTKVASSLMDQRPSIPHDEVMAEMDAIIAEAETSAQKKS
ncbi:antitoxin [Acidithiobacillus sp. IBUN Pt1247-S3]|uniref:type II toxin-antitoxin system RelB family antitoxin n=1 Tax=Acidithiobacillus sp. IBUN Pt1247-S3 TaxID=3166642 RepID=UPI0034E47729